MIAIEMSGNAKGRLTRLQQKVQFPGAMLKVAGRRGRNELVDHFRRRDTVGNRLGGRRTHWWAEVARSVQQPSLAGNTRVTIDVTHPGIAQKVFGGEIRAKRAKNLTIPVAPEAHGLRVSTLERELGIELFRPRKAGGGFHSVLAAKEDEGLRVYYVLKPSVDQAPDPDALPNERTFERAIVDEAERYYQREIDRNQP